MIFGQVGLASIASPPLSNFPADALRRELSPADPVHRLRCRGNIRRASMKNSSHKISHCFSRKFITIGCMVTPEETMNAVVNVLETVLADTYALFLKTQNYHWNVEGRNFKALHDMFESQYNDLFAAIDTVGELIRSLGSRTIGTFEDFARLTNVKGGDRNASGERMVADLLHDHELIGQTLSLAIEVAEDNGEAVVAALLGERMARHKKIAWMLRSTLAG
jgi:starvation-inducible DNA-binding protein